MATGSRFFSSTFFSSAFISSDTIEAAIEKDVLDKKWIRAIIPALFFFFALTLTSTAFSLPAGFQQETILSGNLDEPVVLAELPDGAMLLAQKNGRVFRFDPREQPAQIRLFLQIANIEWGGERGINGLVLDPDFALNGYIYVFYTHQSTHRNRISRFTAVGEWADVSTELMLWQDNEDWSDCCHYGGGLAFGPDDKLYLSTGEEFDGPQAQDLTRAGGKIIRINKDGSIPADNPFVDGPGGNLDEIWAYGLRNPFRAHWDLVANRMFMGEVGGNVQETAREDIHIGRRGANYGWPYCEGDCNNPAWDAPIYNYAHTGETPAGGAVVAGFTYYGSQFPFAYSGKFFFADYVSGWIKYLVLNADGSLASVQEFTGPGDWLGAPVFLMQSSDGALWYVDIIGSVGRITYNSGNQAPVIQSATGTPTTGSAPLAVSFAATATDPEQDPLTYRWLFGDGTEANGTTASRTYSQNGVYTAYAQVSDGAHTTLSAPIRISVGNAPVVTITTPLNGALFEAGQSVAFAGIAADPDETIPAANYRWDIAFVHNAHTHPTLSGYAGQNGTLQINTSGHDYHDSTAYRITLQVTDSNGLTGTATTTVYPRKVNLSLSTVPAGLPVFLDGVQLATPISYDTMVGFQHVVSAANTACVGSTAYTFNRWSDNGAQTHQVTVPTTNTALVAEYIASGSCGAPPGGGLVLRLETDTGVVSNNGVVSGWNDQSGSGLNLGASGEPQLVANALNGRAAIDFDGVNDRLTRAGTLAALPAGNGDREIYAVVNYRGAGYGGISYGTPAINQTFGLGVDPTGKLMVQGWGVSNDFISTATGTGAGWMVQAATLNGGTLAHFQNGNLLASLAHTFGTANSQLYLGAEIDGAPHVNMQVAAVLVYNRALTATERDAVYAYLNGKYFTQGGNLPPVANADTVSIASGGNAAIAVLANDQDSDGTLNPASVLITQAPAYGSATVNTNGTIQYQHTGGGTGTDTFRYSVADDGGLRSNITTVTVTLVPAAATLPTAGLVLRLEADAGIESTEAIVTAWRDQSGRGNDLTFVGDPRLALAGSPNGSPVVDFDGSAARLQRLGGLNGLPTASADRTVVMLANYRGVGDGGFAYGNVGLNQTFGTIVNPDGLLKAQAWGHLYDATSTTPGTGAGWLMQTARLQSNQLSHYKNLQQIGSRAQVYETGGDRIVLGAEIDNAPDVNMQVAAVLVYDRALSTAELSDAYNYLRAKFITATTNQPPVAVADSANVASGSSVTIPVLANDSDADGMLNPASVAIVTAPTKGTATINPTTGVITYTHTGASGSDSFTYRVADAQGLFSGNALVSITIGGSVVISPQDCLTQTPGATAADCVIPMFNGASLGDTYPWFSGSGASDPTEIFKVENGLMHVSGNGLGALISNQRYQNYTMVLEFKWGTQTWGPRAGLAKDAGLFVHSTGVEGGFAGIWLPGLQAQIGDGMMGDLLNLEGVDAQGAPAPVSFTATTDQVTCTYDTWNCRGGYRWKTTGTARLFDTALGTAHWTNWDPDWQDVIGFRGDNDPDSPDGEWNQMVIVANGTTVTVYVNGIKVNEATQVSPSSGKVQLEVEWAEFYVRRWELWPLDGAPSPVRPLSIVSNTLPAATPGTTYGYTLQTIGGAGPRSFSITAGQLPAGLGLNAGTGAITGTPSVSGTFPLTVRVIDDTGYADTQALSLTVLDGSGAIPANGLVLHLEADSGVEATGGIVSLWRDLSTSQNNLSGAGDPRLLATGSPNGKPVLDFDGSLAKLQRVGGVANLPTASADRTVIMLANYRGVGDGGFAYGNVALNQMFGTIVNPQGLLKAQAWGTTFDATSTAPGTGAGWLVQTAVLQSSQLSHYKDLQLIGSRSQTYATVNNQIVLGAEIDSDPYVDMQVAAVLVYNRALSSAERASVTAYLQNKYLVTTTNLPPVATADTATVVRGGSVGINVLANDNDPEGALNPASVAIVTAPASGVASVNTSTGAITYTHGGASLAGDSFTYRVADAQGVYSAPVAVTVSVTAPDAGLTLTAPLPGAIVVGSSVTLNYTLSGSGYDHLHVRLDGGPEIMIMQMTGSFTFPDVAPGSHSITAELADTNHAAIPGTAKTVTFEVQAATAGSLPTSGLVLRLESDSGVSVTGTQVTGWTDQSGLGNHLTGVGTPQRVAAVLNGRPVVDFGGNGAKLQRIGGLNGLPTGAADRTVILLANYRGVGYGGFAWGNVDFNDVFGTVVTPQGYLMTQGWGVTNDAPTTTAGTGAGWLIQAALLQGNQLSQYKDLQLIGSRAQVYTTGTSQLVLGAEIDSDPYVDMQVAAVLVYNRALSTAEYTQAVTYLQQKYLQAGGNLAPVANADSATVAQGQSVTIPVLANDSDPDGTLNAGSVLILRDPAAATLVVNAQNGSVLYQHNGTAPASDSFDYRVTDNGGALSNTATVTVAVTAPNLPPVALADSALVTAAGSVTIPVALNDSDPEAALNPAAVAVVTPPTQGSLVNNGNGTLTYTRNGGAGTDAFTYTIADVEGQISTAATVTVEAVAGVPASGLVLWLEGTAGAIAANGVVSSWLDQSSASNHLAAAGAPLLLTGVAKGHPVIDLNGINAKLQRLTAPTGFPTGAADRSVYLALKYRSNGYGGFAYGTTSCNNVFGVGVSPQGQMMVQGWCSDFISGFSSVGGGFVVQSVNLANNVLDHYLNGQLIDRQTHAFATLPGPLVLGAEIDSDPYVSMQVAAVLVFNRALSTAEHQALTAYLYNRYVAP